MSKHTLTTATGSPVADDDNSISVGERGPLTFDSYYTFDKLAHFNRERIPERIVHARGTGAYGIFAVSNSLENYTIASFLQKAGQKTELAGHLQWGSIDARYQEPIQASLVVARSACPDTLVQFFSSQIKAGNRVATRRTAGW